ncbi:hypothetical protein CVS40_6044 [Lucilia cuprina]|nr:hypothetical protein CVS40_6044 [Lucilia cuprina]
MPLAKHHTYTHTITSCNFQIVLHDSTKIVMMTITTASQHHLLKTHYQVQPQIMHLTPSQEQQRTQITTFRTITQEFLNKHYSSANGIVKACKKPAGQCQNEQINTKVQQQQRMTIFITSFTNTNVNLKKSQNTINMWRFHVIMSFSDNDYMISKISSFSSLIGTNTHTYIPTNNHTLTK